jgi:hypothetical protein
MKHADPKYCLQAFLESHPNLNCFDSCFGIFFAMSALKRKEGSDLYSSSSDNFNLIGEKNPFN